MLSRLFETRRVAVVGVSPAPDNLGRVIVDNMLKLGYDGEIFPVGRGGGEVAGLPIWPSAGDLPSAIDLAVIIVPVRHVAGVLDDCGRRGARFSVIATGGFSEYGDGRAEIEAEIMAVARRHDMRIIGPNCLGVVDLATGLATPFSPIDPALLRRGPASVIMQSGGVAQILVPYVGHYGPGLNKFMAIGNKLDLDEVDYLSYLSEDESTAVIGLYLEDFRRGRAFVDVARRCRKPILLYKANDNPQSALIARSHTAALASDDRVVEAALKAAGVVRVRSLRQLAIAAGVLRLPRLRGNRIAVICSSGGISVILADRCAQLGFALPTLDATLLAEIESWGRAGVIRLTNPLDMGDVFDPDLFVAAVRRVVALPEIDGALVVCSLGAPASSLLAGGADREAAMVRSLRSIGDEQNKPICLCSMGGTDGVVELSHAADFPVIVDPEDAALAMRALLDYSMNSGVHAPPAPADGLERREVADRLVAEALAAGRRELGLESMAILAGYGLPVLVPRLAANAAEARDAAAAIGRPVAMKIRSPDIMHKSDVGGVRLGVRTPAEAAAAYDGIVAAVRRLSPHARVQGVDVQPMVSGGWEVIIGGRRDPQFGPVVMFGMGGIYVEALDEVAFRLAPVSRAEARAMIAELRTGRLLSGLRGAEPADVEALAAAIERLSLMMADLPQIVELDLNPVQVLPAGEGCLVVDARMILGSQGEEIGEHAR